MASRSAPGNSVCVGSASKYVRSASALCSTAGMAQHDRTDALKGQVLLLHKNGFKVSGIKRDQDPVSKLDVVRLHGYVTLKLVNTEGSLKFMRIDWCNEGFHFQLEDFEEELSTHLMRQKETDPLFAMGISGATMAAASPPAHQAALNLAVAANAGVELPAASALWAGEAALAPVATGVLVSAVAVFVVVAGVGVTAHFQHKWSDYIEPRREDSLSTFFNWLREFHPESKDKFYDPTNLNCNHVANAIFEFFAGESSAE